MAIHHLHRFFKSETTAGIVLMAAAVLALLAKNSFLAPYYEAFREMPLSVGIGQHTLVEPLLFWVNDAMMAVFFLSVGLELKKEMCEGILADRAQIMLPAIGALGGMVIPSLIFFLCTVGYPTLWRGWAIPSATDIAFSLAILSLLGRRVPVSLKIFLTSLAIFDDMGAIIIIALVYAAAVSIPMLLLAGGITLALVLLNRSQVKYLTPYLLLAVLLWLTLEHSGIHATIAGVIVALTLPLQGKGKTISPVDQLQKLLTPWVAYLIIPLFGFMNAGVSLLHLDIEDIFHPVTLGVGLGLFVGKQLGIMLACFLLIKWKSVSLPGNSSWQQFYGVAVLGGIGFTMSLFIGSLAFSDSAIMEHVKLGVLAGSVLSAIVGYAVLRWRK